MRAGWASLLLPWLLAGSLAGCEEGAGSAAPVETNEAGEFVLGSVPIELDGLRGTADFLEVGGQPTVRLRMTNETGAPLYWVKNWPGCHWSGWDTQAEWADPRRIRRSSLMSVGCSWFEGSRSPTRQEIDSYRVAPAQAVTWSANIQPDGWQETDSEGGPDGEPLLKSWRFSSLIAVPMAQPPGILPQGWKRQELRFSWSRSSGPALKIGKTLAGFEPHD